MFSKFIQRPVLAISISLAIIFLGILAIYTRPVSQFPEIARAPVTRSIPAAPVETSFAARRADTRPPEAIVRREVVATRPPRERPIAWLCSPFLRPRPSGAP